MNVLIAADYQSPYAGNFIASLIELGERMNENGNAAFFLFPKRSAGERFWVQIIREKGFPVFQIDMTTEGEKICDALREIMSDNQISILHCHFGIFNHEVIYKPRVFGNTKVLIHDHMGFSIDSNVKKQIVKNLVRSIIFRLHGIGVISVLKDKDTSYRLNLGHHWYVPNGVSFRRCIDTSEPREICRLRNGISDSSKLVLAFGWDFRIKGIDIAIKAVELARERNSNIELAIVLQQSELTDEQKGFLSQNNINPNCEWLHFWNSTEDVYSYHRAADVFLSSSRTESFSYSVLEAISQDKPVVMSNIPGVQWARKYNKSYTYSTESFIECASAIVESLAENGIISNYSEIADDYSIKKWCARIMGIYQKL